MTAPVTVDRALDHEAEYAGVGSRCYLVNLREGPDLNGRVVTVISGPMNLVGDALLVRRGLTPGIWQAFHAPWVEEMFPGCLALTRPSNLRPLAKGPPLTGSLDADQTIFIH